MNRPLIALVVGAAAALPGCIVQDIHDQIALSNDKLQQIDDSFTKVERANELLNKLDAQLNQLAQLESINGNLTAIDAKLGTIDGNLESMDARIASLEKELAAVSEHLASLRKTINNIDSTIPFLKISGDDEETKDALQTETPPAADPAQPEKDSAE